jgi:hypothetical protein
MTMAIRTFKTMVGIESYLESACEKAIMETAKIAQEELTRCIQEQYYNDPGFYPNVYQRTEEFLRSASYQMLSKTSAEIYIDIQGMHYRNGFNPWQVVSWGVESKHGSDYYQTSTQDFWTTFVEWANLNLINILKQNLRKNGINVN